MIAAAVSITACAHSPSPSSVRARGTCLPVVPLTIVSGSGHGARVLALQRDGSIVTNGNQFGSTSERKLDADTYRGVWGETWWCEGREVLTARSRGGGPSFHWGHFDPDDSLIVRMKSSPTRFVVNDDGAVHMIDIA